MSLCNFCSMGLDGKRAKSVYITWDKHDSHTSVLPSMTCPHTAHFLGMRTSHIEHKKSQKGTEVEVTDTTKNQEEFEAMKRKTKNILLGMIAVIIAAVAGVAIFKVTR